MTRATKPKRLLGDREAGGRHAVAEEVEAEFPRLSPPARTRVRHRTLAALLDPLVPAATAPMEVVATHEIAVAVEVDADFIPSAAPRTAALV